MDLKALFQKLSIVSDDEIKRAVDALKKGELIAYPTEAVYGLGCDPFNLDAIGHLLRIKKRSIYKGLIVVASHWNQVECLIEPIEPRLMAHIHNTWPGPITWVFPAKPEVPQWITGDKKTVAIRVSDHPVVRALCDSFGGPIISTSANVSDTPPTRDSRTVTLTFDDDIAMIVHGNVGKNSKPTEIRDAITGEVLRHG